MSRTKTLKRRAGAAIAALAATVAGAALLASPAAAASAGGEAFLKPAQHDKGRTLSGQGVAIVAGSGAGTANGMVSLPLSSLDGTTAGTSASLSFERGKRSLALTGISFDLANGTLNGTLGGQQLAVFKLGGAVTAHPGGFSLQGGKLSLTGPAAAALKQRLGLQRALVRRAVGMAWLSAQLTPAAAPTPAPVEPPKPSAASRIVGGSIGWGFVSSWRGYVLMSPPAGSEEVLEGATATGPLTSPATTFGFAASGGTYTAATGSAPVELSLATTGSVKWAKPGHGISEVKLANLEIELGSSGSWLVADVSTNFGAPQVSDDVRFASLDPSGVSAAVNGSSITWTAVPATLTAEGAASFAGFYQAGKQLEPVTFTAELG